MRECANQPSDVGGVTNGVKTLLLNLGVPSEVRWGLCTDDDSIDLIYYEVTEYNEPDIDDMLYTEAACSDASSTVDSSSSVLSVLDEQALEGEPCAIWPLLEDSSPRPFERASASHSERFSERDSICSADDVGDAPELPCSAESAAALIASASLGGPDSRRVVPMCTFRHEADCRRGSPCGASCGETLSMSQVLARRFVAAPLLTHGCARREASPLPALPAAVAQLILDLALPLSAPLAAFVKTTGVDLPSALQLTNLNLSSCGLCADGAGVVGWLLRHNPRVRELDVSGNCLGADGATLIVSAVPGGCGLTHLKLNDVSMCSAGGTDPSALTALAHVLDAPGRLGALEVLQLRENAIGASGLSGFRALCTAMSGARCPLRSIDLRGNLLQSTGAVLLAAALLHANGEGEGVSLEELYLGNNMITGPFGKAREGIRALAIALALSTTLRVVDLSCNGIGARTSEVMDQWHKTPACATIHLVRALGQNGSLRELDLRGNHLVGSQGVQLTQAWARHTRDGPLHL
eukprot:CAMPEP_0181201244 /NCGR_PEP_ID=MMETSP1096-20121128/18201_1 /TAXON_ID=156174 ORGANISM="Chrysochromulina ericina, Strain CCMP281" /NCGR_SAMPLE_ID=MMETSP1096 /ASSEMBLY_ACC=CAM_ASM_000453 /LENGTH=522 /DNA_ID=CAMNT_0023291669 /DNA_START=65 /DNA_END=1633 /DNA_ORIENTATION=-